MIHAKCVHIFLLNLCLRWSSVLYDSSYCMWSDSFGLWHCSLFSCCLKKKKASMKRPMQTGSICASSPAPGLSESQGRPTLPMFQHHLLLMGHCFPKHYYCFRLSLKGDVRLTVTSEEPGRSALRSGVYNFTTTFCRGWLADTTVVCSLRVTVKSSPFSCWWLFLHAKLQGLHSHLHCYKEES